MTENNEPSKRELYIFLKEHKEKFKNEWTLFNLVHDINEIMYQLKSNMSYKQNFEYEDSEDTMKHFEKWINRGNGIERKVMPIVWDLMKDHYNRIHEEEDI